MTEIPYHPSRRDILKLGIAAPLIFFPELSADSPASSQPEAPIPVAPETTRVDQLLRVINRDLSPELAQLDKQWVELQIEQETPTPGVIEGAATGYGPAATASSQLQLWATTFEEILSGARPNNASISQSRMKYVIDIAKHMVADIQLANVELNSPAYANRFSELLNEFGIMGVIATKSPADFGRIFDIQIWDRVSECYVVAGLAIVLDVATRETFETQAKNNYRFENVLHNEFPVSKAWIGDVSNELLRSANVPIDNSALFIRAKEVGESSFIIGPNTYPQYARSAEISPGFREMGFTLKQILSHPRFVDLIKQLSRDDVVLEAAVTMSELPANLITSAHMILGQNYSIPLFQDATLSDVGKALAGQEGFVPGFPMGNFSQHTLLQRLADGHVLHKSIIAANRQDNLSEIGAGLFVVEDYPSVYGSNTPLLSGFMVNNDGLPVYVYANGTSTLTAQDQAQIEIQLLNPETGLVSPTRRLVVFW